MRSSTRTLLRVAVPALVLAVLFVVDARIAGTIATARAHWADVLFDGVSELRGIVFFAAASSVLFAVGSLARRPHLREAGLRMLLAVLVSGLLVAIVKPIVAKDGPLGPPPPEPGESWLSARWGRFPSGHTAAAFSAAAALGSVYPPAAPVGYALGVVVGCERMYRSVHFASDCFAGAWIGIVVARAVARRRSRPPGSPSLDDRESAVLHSATN